MKNHIVFKFIAIVLCAASLMGAVGCISGVALLSGADLYNQTVDEFLDQRLKEECTWYANELAASYASKILGGCPDAMIGEQYGSWFQRNYPDYGYTILDGEGNVVSSYNTSVKDSGFSYSLPVTGKYMYLVSTQSESERQATEPNRYSFDTDSEPYLYDNIPPEGCAVTHFFAIFADGGSANYDSGNGNLGFLFYNQEGCVVFRCFDPLGYDSTMEQPVVTFSCTDESGETIYEVSDPAGVGTIAPDENGCLVFKSYTLEPVDSEPAIAAAAVPETVPETTVEVTEETVAETQVEVMLDENGNPIEAEAPAYPDEDASDEADTAEEEAEPFSDSEEPEEGESEEGTEWVDTDAPEAAEAAIAEETIPETEPPTEPAVAQTLPAETVPLITLPKATEPVMIEGKPLSDYQVNRTTYYDSDTGEHMTAEYVYLTMPELTVEVYVDQTSMQDAGVVNVMRLVRQVRSYLLPAIGICLLIFAVFAVYLCTAAGRKPGSEEVRAGGLNRIPLDLYLVGCGFAISLLIIMIAELSPQLLQRDFMTGCGLTVGSAFLACLVFVGFCFAFVAQIKTPGGFWWRNSLCGYFLRLCVRFARWLETFLSTRFFPWAGRLLKKLWKFTCLAAVWLFHGCEKGFQWLGNILHRFLSLLPLVWQWLLAGCLIFLLLLLSFAARSEGMVVLSLCISLALILYGAYCFGNLMESTKRMSKGDLDTKVDDKHMIGAFKEFAGDLNDLADVAVVAAKKQLKSERMKTELITNVSHDIKTPLTSIINYVDLLQKPHTDEEGQQYLEVLDRQSQRLKKLIDDLMDMSKASTGNMTVEITKVDAVESVNQALGEFADKLDKAMLSPVFRHDEDSVAMMADGKLVWRVMSNLLSNAVKYALPGTRLYIDLTQLEGKVVISVKNISREELNVDAEELMERFVRGDDSRNTEGSGLGLNIAKSLMELQKGQLQLLVDGDLFKVTLIFPGA